MDRNGPQPNQNRNCYSGEYSREYTNGSTGRSRPNLREGRNFAEPYKFFCYSSSPSHKHNTRRDKHEFSRINDCNRDPNFLQRKNIQTDSFPKNGAATQVLRGSRGPRNFRPLLQQYLNFPDNRIKTGRRHWFRKSKDCFSSNYNSSQNGNARMQHQKWEDANTLKYQDACPKGEGIKASERDESKANQMPDPSLAVKITASEDAVKISNVTAEASSDNSTSEIDIFKIPLSDLFGDVNIENWESMTDEEIKQIELEYLEERQDSKN